VSTSSTILGLLKWATANHFSNTDLLANIAVLDGSPGVFLDTAGTHPSTWTTNQDGRLILDKDTGLMWRWNGTAFVRQTPAGYLGHNRVTAAVNTSSTTYVTALTSTVTVPAGGRNVRLSVSGPGVWSTVDLTKVALFRGATQLIAWQVHGTMAGTAAGQPHPLVMTYLDLAPAAGSTTYTLQYAAHATFGGTSTLDAAANNPLTLTVEEV